MKEIWYHGTNKKNVKSILKNGFKVGTWFAHDMWDSLRFGGDFIFAVCLDRSKISEDVTWQCHTMIEIPVDLICFYFNVKNCSNINENLLSQIVHEKYYEPKFNDDKTNEYK